MRGLWHCLWATLAVFVPLTVGMPAAHADTRYVLEPGDTLEAVARKFGCDTQTVMRANRVDTTLLPAGTHVRVPSCRRRAARTAAAQLDRSSAKRSANPALAAIDGVRSEAKHDAAELPASSTGGSAGPLRQPRDLEAGADAAHGAGASTGAVVTTDDTTDETSASIGRPWRGKLQGGQQLPAGVGYTVRRPLRTWGAPHAVTQVQQAIANVRNEFPALHDLAVGDMSKHGGGKIDDHRSHQSGLDIDIGLYFTILPANYPTSFAVANDALDLDATWALVAAFANQATQAEGVRVIFLDHQVAGRLYRFAQSRGVEQATLDAMFEFPHGKRAGVGLIRHEPHHADHLHVRYRCATTDTDCTDP